MIEPGVNYRFLAESFIQAKKDGSIKGVGLEGASRTGKTFDICIFICQYINTYQDKLIVIGRDKLTVLKNTNYETLKKVWRMFGYPMAVFNKVASDININGNTIKFIGVNDDIEKAGGLESDLLWLNEAFSVVKEAKDQLEQRCTGFFIYDYNPKAIEHHIYDLEKREDYRLLKTVIFDNPHAPENPVQKILSYAHPDTNDWHLIKDKPEFKKRFTSKEKWLAFKNKNVELKTANNYLWQVYGLGLRAVGDDIVFSDGFKLYSGDVEDYDWKAYWGDFGFKNDPTSFGCIIKKGKALYLKEHIYETGLTNPDIAEKIQAKGCNDEMSFWDKAEEKSVYELNALGIQAYAPAKTHIAWGIQKLEQFELYIHEDSHNTQKEFSTYRYLRDAKGDFKRNTLGHKIAHDIDNHSIDGCRYVLHHYYKE